MRLTARKTEVDAVVALLESDQYDSAQALAKAIIAATWEQLLERDMWAMLYRFESSGLTLSWGPFSSEKEAESWGAKIALPGPARLLGLKLASPAAQARINETQLALSAPALCKCSHPKWTHENQGYSGKCAQGGCPCKKYRPET